MGGTWMEDLGKDLNLGETLIVSPFEKMGKKLFGKYGKISEDLWEFENENDGPMVFFDEEELGTLDET